MLQAKEASTVEYRNINFYGNISVPIFHCDSCNTIFQPSAIQCGCFPSSPTVAYVWYDELVVELYNNSGLSEGLSCKGLSLSYTHRRLIMFALL